MNISEKLLEISKENSNIQEKNNEIFAEINIFGNKKYDSGYSDGYDKGEAAGFSSGQKAEYDRFWDNYQDNGNRTNYNYAFSYTWNDECYNPKYPIVCKGNGGNSIFNYNQRITDTKGAITFEVDEKGASSASYAFNWCRRLRSAHIIVNEKTKFTGTFGDCISLTDLTVDGVIGQNGFDVSVCPLTVASLNSISLALANYYDTEPGTYIITIGSNNYDTLVFSPEGNGIIQTMEGKGWTIQ